jgi:hypothetical protein
MVDALGTELPDGPTDAAARVRLIVGAEDRKR